MASDASSDRFEIESFSISQITSTTCPIMDRRRDWASHPHLSLRKKVLLLRVQSKSKVWIRVGKCTLGLKPLHCVVDCFELSYLFSPRALFWFILTSKQRVIVCGYFYLPSILSYEVAVHGLHLLGYFCTMQILELLCLWSWIGVSLFLFFSQRL